MARARAALACVSTGACRRRCPARHGREQARRHHQQPAEHHRRQRRDLGFELQVLQPLLEPPLEVIGPLARLGRVELGIGLAGPLLELELLGAVVPVGDLLGQPVLHRDFGLGDELELAVPHLLEVLRHDLGDGVALRLLLDLASDPRALGPVEDRLHARFALGQRPVVEVGRVVEVAGRPVGVELDVEHPLGDDATLARAGEARVLDRMLDVEQHSRPSPWVALVHQHRAALEQVAMAFEREVDDRVEQRMARADEGGQGLAVRRHQILLEGDALVAGQHRLADADQAVAVAHRGRDVGDLVAARLPLLGRAAQKPERLVEEGLDIVRLEAAGLGPLHIFADALDPAGVHGVVGERPFFQQVPQLAAVERDDRAPSSGGPAPRADRRTGSPR